MRGLSLLAAGLLLELFALDERIEQLHDLALLLRSQLLDLLKPPLKARIALARPLDRGDPQVKTLGHPSLFDIRRKPA